MDLTHTLNGKSNLTFIPELESSSTTDSFITANTEVFSLDDIRQSHIIPVYLKDNETSISQVEFIQLVYETVSDLFHGERILNPAIRLSHPIKGRTPEAKDKPVHLLESWEKTIYYERMMFAIEIPSVTESIGGNKLSLTVGGVKAYNHDNLYNRKGSVDEHFKLFIGFQNKVCTNMCVWSDGYAGDLRARDIKSLRSGIFKTLSFYNPVGHVLSMDELTEFSITEKQFANLIGRCRMYNHLSNAEKVNIPKLLLGDQQINMVCKDFYGDKSFCKDSNGNINLWRLYNLFTGATKTTYIDQFLDRSVNAFTFVKQIQESLQSTSFNWYLN